MSDFPEGFFRRTDESSDSVFYGPPRLVTHIDDRAIAAVGAVYEHLNVAGRVLDLMSSWVSHFHRPPLELTVLGMNAAELQANSMAAVRVVHDLNAAPELPFEDATFDAAVCCVSVDYLTQPIEVFRSVRRVVVVGAPLVITFSNRLFAYQGDPRLAGHRRPGPHRHRRRVLPPRRRVERAAGNAGHPAGNARRSPLRRLGHRRTLIDPPWRIVRDATRCSLDRRPESSLTIRESWPRADLRRPVRFCPPQIAARASSR